MKWRLGLDLGSNSLGWAAIELSKEGNPIRLIDCGSRIFSDGRNAKSMQSNAADRRGPRGARRNRDRYIKRRTEFMDRLVEHELMPKDMSERRLLESHDPWILRARGLDEALSPYEFGRALFHLQQRRGFKSNRKTDRGDNDKGKVADAKTLTKNKLDEVSARTLGELFGRPRLKALEFNETAPKGKRQAQPLARVRKFGEGAKWAYEYYPTRDLILHEFDMLWAAQANLNPSAYTGTARDKLRDTLAFQRPLKSPPVGKCTLIPEEPRAPKALPSNQLRRLYEEVNALLITPSGQKSTELTLKQRDTLIKKLEVTGKLTFSSMRKLLKLSGYDFFNTESEKRKHLDGDQTAAVMRHKARWGKDWDVLPLSEQDEIINHLLEEESETDLCAWLEEKYGFEREQALIISDAPLPAGVGKLSKKAIDKLLPALQSDGKPVYSEAVEAAFGGSHSNFDTGEIFDTALPYYGEILTRSVAFEKPNPKNDEERYGKVANPTVHVSLNQVRKVINELMQRFGAPEQIVLELSRDLPMGAEDKRKMLGTQKKNQEANEERALKLKKLGVPNNYQNRFRLRLFEEMNAIGKCCVFTGQHIGLDMLFSDEVEIEHLLPFSWSFDNGIANKVLCLRDANRAKGNKTPFEAFGDSPNIAGRDYNWEEISARAQGFLHSKRKRFAPDAREQFERNGDFIDRQLTDNQYIARLARQYVSAIYGGQGHKGSHNQVWVVTGRLTSDLRWNWGLDSILAGHNAGIGDKEYKKNRSDHRHHAIDAVVIALTDRSMVKRASDLAKIHNLTDERLLAGLDDPWPDFRETVSRKIGEIKVSHKPDHGVQGALHNDTAYGFIKGKDGEPDKKGARTVVRRVPLDSFDKPAALEKIRDHVIKLHLLQETEGLTGKDFKAALLQAGEDMHPPVRKIRIEEKLRVIPIKDKSGKAYKAYKGDSNYCYDIWMGDPDKKGNAKWDGEVISTFDANQKGFDWRSKTARNGKPLIMRIRKNDYLEIEHEKELKLMQVVKFSTGMIAMAEHFEANVDARTRDKEDPLKFVFKSPSSLQKAKARRATISPSGILKLY